MFPERSVKGIYDREQVFDNEFLLVRLDDAGQSSLKVQTNLFSPRMALGDTHEK